ncbi:MAG: uL22 family ribosomal protein, partial [Candidatus Roizmanbacteria bacterium]|nr:uL22 family ribosomal protein [Candidatus Roizmanbacteria bacterium]
NFKLLSVEQGQKLKRYKPGSRGNAKPINRRMSHIKIILEAKVEKKTEPKVEISKPKELKSKVKNQNSKIQIKSKK